MNKNKIYKVSVVVSEWEEEREDLPSENTEITFEYTKEDLEDYEDLDSLVGDLLFERYGCVAFDYCVL